MPPAARRIIQHEERNTISNVGPKLSSIVTNSEVPVDGDVALITTPFGLQHRHAAASLLANSGSSVTNSVVGAAVLFGG